MLEDKGMQGKVREGEEEIRKEKAMGREGGIRCSSSVLSPLKLKVF